MGISADSRDNDFKYVSFDFAKNENKTFFLNVLNIIKSNIENSKINMGNYYELCKIINQFDEAHLHVELDLTHVCKLHVILKSIPKTDFEDSDKLLNFLKSLIIALEKKISEIDR